MSLYRNCAAFFAELAGNGVTDVVLSPGSRSTPLSISARFTRGLTCHVNMDERAAAFFALGLAKASGRPVALICTSGSAAANYLPAIVEGHFSGVPLLVLTADRPPELRNWGAGQTIDQIHLYGSHVRSFAEFPCGRDADEAFFRRAGARMVADATRGWPGPVHRNWPFREPLEPDGALVEAAPSQIRVGRATVGPEPEALDRFIADTAKYERGVIAVGPSMLTGDDCAVLCQVARDLRWPVIADPASQLRRGAHTTGGFVVAHGDLLLRSAEFADRHRPDAVLRIGASLTSKAFRLWLERSGPPSVTLLTEPGRWEDPSFTSTQVIESDVSRGLRSIAAALSPRPATDWISSWQAADAAADDIVAAAVANELTELSIARLFTDALGDEATAYVASSMPIRDVDTAMAIGAGSVSILVNRGANGIDGLIASAAGASVFAGRVQLLLGDVAFLHDIGSVLEAGRCNRDLTVVVVDNDGGGIFSMLPVAKLGESVAFEELFTTPHRAALQNVGAFPGIRVSSPRNSSEFTAALESSTPGVHVIHVVVDRDKSLAQRQRVVVDVAEALRLS